MKHSVCQEWYHVWNLLSLCLFGLMLVGPRFDPKLGMTCNTCVSMYEMTALIRFRHNAIPVIENLRNEPKLFQFLLDNSVGPLKIPFSVVLIMSPWTKIVIE